jgi:hypothetical protein
VSLWEGGRGTERKGGKEERRKRSKGRRRIE